ncbi:unnamed protein product [Fraxinus pennsylvanica]|uniref:NB-ARC domain-containing protein n=1 Tax=Fraxinus pennsylvanica TaxID=56036 RepID=A0AAD2A5B1_9LAMI|nr:unnamed protein product [Fraxinus pennsylvanica]
MDDALDEWETANLQLQIEGSEELSDPWEKIISFIQSICLCFEHVVGRREINLKIKGFIEKLDSIDQKKDEFGFLPSGGHDLQEFNRNESTSFVDSASVHGRTFNDPEVKEHFNPKIWICVSDTFDVKKIAKSILEAVGKNSSNTWGLQTYLEHVKDSVSNKRFLIVLDDVWTEDRERWEPLKNSLQGAPGSRILVTTRSERVARAISTDTRQPLGQLSHDECWSLLRIYKLINLRHLLFDCDSNSIPQGVERLTGLWILSGLIAGRGSRKLGYLRKLNQLRGSLKLFLGDLTELEDLVDAENAELKNKKYIQVLNFYFAGEVMVDIMEALQPPPNLHYLRMFGYKGTQLPVWITTSLNYLRVLNLSLFGNYSSLPPLGKLPMLEELNIIWMDSMKYVGNEFLGIMEPNAGPAFPKLRKLLFSECDNWEKWEDITGDEKDHLLIMPCLRELEIIGCDKLKALPHCLLRTLEYLTVKYSLCLASLYGDRTGDEWDKISHIPHIKVDSLEDINRYDFCLRASALIRFF